MNSHQVTQGVDRAPHRSLFFAAGFTEEELERYRERFAEFEGISPQEVQAATGIFFCAM